MGRWRAVGKCKASSDRGSGMRHGEDRKGDAKDTMSLRAVADELVKSARRIVRTAKTEEDLKIKFERVLGPLVESAGIVFDERYERGSTEAKTILRGKRPDAIHGQVVVEYEPPESFKSERRIEHAYGQLVEYMTAEAKAAGKDAGEGSVGIVGVGFDGSAVFFVRCRTKKTRRLGTGALEFVKDGPYMFGSESALTFTTCLRALGRVPLTAENLAERFGPKSEVARGAVGAFADALDNWSTPRVKVFLEEWERLFGIVYGEQFGGGADKKTRALADIYGLAKEIDFRSMLFCVHTYFALLMKLIAVETAKGILANIRGFDFNPLAVIASRTNYLFALGDLTKELGEFEIPVYLADSVLWPKRRGQMLLGGDGAVEVPTAVGTFQVPKIWVDDPAIMRRAAPAVEELAKLGCNAEEAMDQLKKQGLVFPPHDKVVRRFYEHVLQLERDGRNGIWARFLKNVFAPLMAGSFDFVIGNPPWIRWGYLSQEYREATLEMWKDYGLFSLKGHAARLGGGEKDFSMLFTYAAADHYLASSGTLGFLITQEVFKSKGAGEGFRKFRLGDRETLKVVKAHDLVSVQPFEGAANKTAAIFLKKRGQTEYPVPYVVWKRKKGVGRVPTGARFKEAKRLLDREELAARPIGKITGSWQTIAQGDVSLRRIEGCSAYKARRGASTEPYGVFWLEVKEVLSSGDLIVRNLVERGKKKISQVEERVEADLVFPAVCGADIRRWGAEPEVYVLMV